MEARELQRDGEEPLEPHVAAYRIGRALSQQGYITAESVVADMPELRPGLKLYQRQGLLVPEIGTRAAAASQILTV